MRTGTSHSQIRNAKDPFAVAVYRLINTKPAITYESQFIRVCSKGAGITNSYSIGTLYTSPLQGYLLLAILHVGRSPRKIPRLCMLA